MDAASLVSSKYPATQKLSLSSTEMLRVPLVA